MAAKSKKKRGTKQTRTKKKSEQSFITDEIVIWITLAVSILILLSLFGLGGRVGKVVSRFLTDIFGTVTYIVPFLLFGIVAFVVSNKENFKAYLRALAAVFLTVLLCTFFQLINKSGGGTGAAAAGLLTPAVGIAGTYVIVIILMIVCLVIITGKSVLKGVKSQSNKAYGKARGDVERHRKAAQERRREREAERERSEPLKSKSRKRRDNHVEGVSFDTALAKEKKDIRELTVDVMEDETSSDVPGFSIQRNDTSIQKNDTESLQAEASFGEFAEPSGASDFVPDTGIPAKERAYPDAENHSGKPRKSYKFPPLSLLKRGKKAGGDSDSHLKETALKLQQTLQNFGVHVTVTNVSCGPAVTRYELQPEMGVKVSKIVGLADDIKLNLAAADIRIEAPIPGKAAVGIEVPNKENTAVMLRDLLESQEFKKSTSKLSFAAGKDIAGKAVVTDIAKMPHVLIAGATGSGKSVCINTLIMSILYKAAPEEVKLIMIDPKVVELSVYNGIPHLMIPVVTDPKKAAGALNWAVAEMDRRYRAFAEYNVRDMKGYNEKIKSEPAIDGEKPAPMSQLVIIVDELADLMMVASGDVEGAICRLAQLARAAGIHLVVATQRPSVNVITGLIKANMPSRIAFAVSSGVDSRTIIDMNGAEKLLGKGDMLFYPAGYPKPARVQGSFVTDEEVQSVVEFLRSNNTTEEYDEEMVSQVTASEPGIAAPNGEDNDRDAYFTEAGRLIIDKEKASIGMLQRTFKIGFNRAARIMDQLCEAGVVGGEEGTKPRKVLMSKEEFEQYVEQM
ncbi:DNA translocase FtsK 4TM domain-containing protein [Lachnospiraceae bacterium MD308]|nr:DNA translocase FtsK 4TM domain-containing protein [Lachnospiraceae bacterium MD308]MCI8581325.1 DNA translocase FtsK [Dorea sp.]